MAPGGDHWRHLAGAATATVSEPSETELGKPCASDAAGRQSTWRTQAEMPTAGPQVRQP